MYETWESYDKPEHIERVLKATEIEKVKVLKWLEAKLNKGENLEKYVWGYVVNHGGTALFDTRMPIFYVLPKRDQYVSMVLAECIGGGLMWYNYNNWDIKHGYPSDYKEVGQAMYRLLNQIKDVTLVSE